MWARMSGVVIWCEHECLALSKIAWERMSVGTNVRDSPWAHGTFDITCFSHICWSIEPHFKHFVYRYNYSSYVPVLGWKARTAGRQTGTPSWFPALRPHAGLSATPAGIIVITFYNNIDNNIISLQNNILISDLDRKFYAVIKSVHIFFRVILDSYSVEHLYRPQMLCQNNKEKGLHTYSCDLDLRNLTSMCPCCHKQYNLKRWWRNIKKWQSHSQYI